MESLDPEDEQAGEEEGRRSDSSTPWYLNWRFWLGIGIAGLSIWYVGV